MIDIRPATSDDALTLIAVREDMFRAMGIDDEDRIAALRRQAVPWMTEALSDGRAVGFIALEGSAVIGGVSMTLVELQPQFNVVSGRFGTVYGLYVAPEYRGRGTATRLVEHCIAHARDVWRCEMVTLHAAERARPIYERMGFVPTSEMRLLIG